MLNFNHFALGSMYETIFLGILLNANSGMYNLLTIYILHTYVVHYYISLVFFYESCLKRGRGPLNQAHCILNISST